MKTVTAALIGAGDRGMYAYAPYALNNPWKFKFVAVADTNDEKRKIFSRRYGIRENMCFKDYKDFFSRPKLADAVLICTQDKLHYEPAVMAMEKGYDILLEKPISTDPKECMAISRLAEEYDKMLLVCYVLRYTKFFSTIKHIIDSGRIGRLISIQHNENVPMDDQVHSFVRGNWRDARSSCPMILAHCCHDMDIIRWFAGADILRISSFGGLTHFRSENAPAGAPERCLDGCPVSDCCPYYAPGIYLTDNTDWPTSVIGEDLSIKGRIKALREGPYGRCVFHCDNNVVDHQVVNMEFSNKTTAVFTMCAFTSDESRTLKLMGTKGEIRGSLEKTEIEVNDFSTGNREVISIKKSPYRYGGGDYGIMNYFVRSIIEGNRNKGLTSAVEALQSHLMAFAAEESRLKGKVIEMKDYAKQFEF